MIIPCPYCGERDSGEYTRRGEVPAARPDSVGSTDSFVEHVYARTNPAGILDEYWYHDFGCRQWLVVRRDTRSHRIEGATLCGSGPA